MKTEKQRKCAIAGGLCGVAYLTTSFLDLPELVKGLVLGLALGLAVVLLILALLPEEILEKLRKWKRRGE